MPEAAEATRLYRLIKLKHARNALSGRGGLEADGRWHTAGRLIVYLASSEALAVLEVRVHLGSIAPKEPYVLLTVELPGGLVRELPRQRWPKRWDAVPFVAATQTLGDRWLASGEGAALRVPSVHSGSDFNVLLNPAHAEASRAQIIGRTRYEFDTRLF